MTHTTESDLTYAERATCGTCPICQARPGEACVDKKDGKVMTDGYAHMGRLKAAPTKKVVTYDVR